MKILIILLVMKFLNACGYSDETEIVKRPAPPKPDKPVEKAYSFNELMAFCVGCHNSTAPKIPLEESEFKNSAKVKARIQNDTMPPNKTGFNKEKALRFF